MNCPTCTKMAKRPASATGMQRKSLDTTNWGAPKKVTHVLPSGQNGGMAGAAKGNTSAAVAGFNKGRG